MKDVFILSFKRGKRHNNVEPWISTGITKRFKFNSTIHIPGFSFKYPREFNFTKNSSHQSTESHVWFYKSNQWEESKAGPSHRILLKCEHINFLLPPTEARTLTENKHPLYSQTIRKHCIKLTNSSNPDSLLLARWPWDRVITSQTPHFLARYYLPHSIRVKCSSLQFMP